MMPYSKTATTFTGHPEQSGLYLFDGVLVPLEDSSDFAWEVKNGLLFWYVKEGEGSIFKLPHGYILFAENWGKHGPNARSQYVFPEEIAGEFTRLGGPQELSTALWFQDRDGHIEPEDKTPKSEEEDG